MQTRVLFLLIFGLVSLNINFLQTQAQTNKPKPPKNGHPPKTVPASSRSLGDCPNKPELPHLTVLVHKTESTVSQSPTFWVYIPYTPQEAPNGTFKLQDKEGNDNIYSTKFQLTSTPGIVSITLPLQQILEVGTTYRWHVDINCPIANKSKITPANVSGFVTRVAPPQKLTNQLNAAKTPLDRIAAYAEHEIWIERLTELAQLRLQQPDNPIFAKKWVELLSDENIGLKDYAQAPIVGEVVKLQPIP